MKLQFYLSLIIFFILLIKCFNVFAQKNEKTYFTFVQGDRSYRIDHYADSIILEKKPFSILFYCKRFNAEKNELYMARIKSDSYDYSASSGVGSKIEDWLSFRWGTMLALGENGKYSSLYINIGGCQGLYYSNEEIRTVDLISENKGILKLKWDIFQIDEDRQLIPISKIQYPFLSFYILVDRNLNGLVDEGEYKSIKVFFE